MIRDVAVVSPAGQRRREGADRELRVLAEGRDVPRARGIDRRLAEREQVLAVGIFLRLEARAHVGRPGREFLEHRDILRVGELLLAGDQRLPSGLALPVVRADVLEAHGGGLPLVGGAHVDRRIGPVLLQFVEDVMELGHRLRRRGADLLEGVLVVHEAVDDGGHRHAEGRLAVVGGPGRLGDVGEIVEALEVVQPVELVLLIELERRVERPAGDEVAGGAAVELGVQRGVVVRGLRWPKTRP